MHDVADYPAIPVVPRPPPRAAYALPTLFTAGNIFLGFFSILRSIQGAASLANPLVSAEHLAVAAKAIGLAIVLDGLDGRIARLTKTTSEFGKEMDSISDVISFGIAPAVLAYVWGFLFLPAGTASDMSDHLTRAGKVIAFLFLLCGSLRLARFNVQKNPKPKNPGRPNRSYFVGLPIPAAAGLIAAIVYAADGKPIDWWPLNIAWLTLMTLLAWLMVSTWRYYAFKDKAFLKPRSPLTILFIGGLLVLGWYWSQAVLLAMASAYASSGIFPAHWRTSPPRSPVPPPFDSFGASDCLKRLPWWAVKLYWGENYATFCRKAPLARTCGWLRGPKMPAVYWPSTPAKRP